MSSVQIDPINAMLFATHTPKIRNNVDNPEVEKFVMTIDGYTFDVEIHDVETHDTSIATLMVAPRKVPGEKRGCVVLEFDPMGQDTMVNIANIVHDCRCSRKGTKPLEKKYGTRLMVLGALNAMIFLSETRWPSLTTFHLQDESTYSCPPLEKAVRTFATDLFIQDTMYYERHLGVKAEREKVRNLINTIKQVLAGPLVDKYFNFESFWKKLAPKAAGGSYSGLTTKVKAAWLKQHKPHISVEFEKCVAGSVREFFVRMHTLYSCLFFASMSDALITDFKMIPLMGAGYVVSFQDLPRVHVHFCKSAQNGGGPSKARRVMLDVMFEKAQRRKRNAIL